MAYQRLIPGSGVYQEGGSAQRLVPGSGVYQEAVSSGYTLTASVVAFTLTGNATGLRSARRVVGVSGGYTLTGNNAGLRKGYKIAASAGAFALTGVAAALKAARFLRASVGAHALTGNDAGLTYSPNVSYTLTAGAGSFAFVGSAATLRAARRIAAGTASYSLTGNAAALSAPRRIAGGAGAFALTGNAAGLTYRPAEYRLTAEVGVFTLTGVDAQLTKGSRAGGSYDTKKVVIRKGKRLLAFRSYAEAIAALEDGQAIEASPDDADAPVEAPKPVQTVEVREVRRLAQRFDRAAEYQRLIDSAQYSEMLVLYERLRAEQQDEEDVELLLLA